MNVIASGITGIILRAIPPVTAVQLAIIQFILRRAILLQTGAHILHHRPIRVGQVKALLQEVRVREVLA